MQEAPKMKLNDIIPFIPGLNIVYMIREYRAHMSRVRAQEDANAQLMQRSILDHALTGLYASQRNAATERGDFATAKDLDDKIQAIVDSYLR
jgi:hypothetical protein